MQNFQNQFTKLTLSIFASLLLFSCSKDADLLSEYVINTDDARIENSLLINDSFFIEAGQSTIVMDVLNNDNFDADAEVRIIQTSEPLNGIVTINDDNTLTYKVNTESSSETNTTEETTTEETTPEETTPEETIPEETTPEETTPEETTPEETTPEETTPEETTPEETTPEETTQEEAVTDSFTYTTEETDEAGNVTTQEASVTVNIAQNNIATSGTNVYYVTTSGNGGNNGKSVSASWSLAHAFGSAKAGDIIYIKAGNYGSSKMTINKSGASGNTIKFIGYTNEPGDIIANQGSTFNYGDNADATKMPLLDSNNTGEGIIIAGAHVELHNFQVKDFSIGIKASGQNVTLNNVVVLDMGNQSTSGYDGFGIHFMNTSNSIIQNSYIENSTAESFKVYGGGNNRISYLEVRADNPINPTDYYLLLSNTSNNIVEDSRVERAPGLSHPGHGLICKWNSKNNTFRRCETKYTGVEMAFSDVTGNLFEDIRMIGQGRDHYQTNIDFRNGANNNTVRNIHITDVSYAFAFVDDNDGFTPSPDTDVPHAGYNNKIENVVVENASMLLRALPGTLIGGDINAFVRNNIFDNCTFTNYGVLANFYMRNEGNEFKNSSFKNGSVGIKINNGSPYRSDILNNVKFTNCTFENAPQ
ncbi:parallel beta helix pectate lyase-like protein [Maribacter spongiicola]|uniref:Parallel beta helix pectate lyase-like protein n=2 Tax=Maribacter spongiicola TaxID=1206753 RepID=A0A4R7K3T0_9FLAO|nr:parallel beta helix pectate lyase-like protein [Maribacter spongiicola]